MDRDHAKKRVTLHGNSPALVVAFAPEQPSGPSVDPTPKNEPVPKDQPVPKNEPKPSGGAVFGPDNPYRIADLSTQGLVAELADFKRATYLAHVKASSRKRDFVGSLPSADLAKIDGSSKRLLRAAAEQGSTLLSAARGDLEVATSQDNPAAAKTTLIGVNSAYRPVDTQFKLWDGRFEKYFNAYREHELGDADAAVALASAAGLAKYIGARTACPGYSKHQLGRAIDFATDVAGKKLRAGSRTSWRDSWFWNWLVEHAASYEFAPLKSEPWHWNYEGD